jgi:hypothetical protein
MEIPDLKKCPKFIRRWVEPAFQYAKSRTPLSGPGVLFADAADGSGRTGRVTLAGILQAIPSFNFPFQIMYQGTPGVAGSFDYGVYFYSQLFSTDNIVDPTTPPIQTITGLLTSATPTPSDTGWITWNGSPDPVWITGTIGTWPALTSVNVSSYSNGDTYDGGDVENDGGAGSPTVFTQTFFRLLIALIQDDGSGSPFTTQYVRENQKLLITSKDSFDNTGAANENIIAAVYPYPV